MQMRAGFLGIFEKNFPRETLPFLAQHFVKRFLGNAWR